MNPVEEAKKLNADRAALDELMEHQVQGWVRVPSNRWYQLDTYNYTVSFMDYVEVDDDRILGSSQGETWSLPHAVAAELLRAAGYIVKKDLG